MSNTPSPMKLNHLSFPSHEPARTAAFFDVVIDQITADARQGPSSFHVGFELPSRTEVESLHARMVANGVPMETGVISHERGSRFFCRVPGGVMFELNTRADASPKHRGSFE